jgi:ATP-dependent Lon protease
MVTGRPVRRRLAMTGELSLTGHVLPIGGVKEKVIAARRSGMKQLIFPEANRKDFDELPEYLRKGLTVHCAEMYEDVYRAAFHSRGQVSV